MTTVYCESCRNWVDFSDEEMDALGDNFGDRVAEGDISSEDAIAIVHHARDER